MCFQLLQRACYLSLNPQKDETLETEKAQYVLPDGSTLNVSRTDTEKCFGKTLIIPPPQLDHKPWNMTSFSDRSGQVPCSRAAVQTRPDRRWKLGDPRGAGLCYPEVWHGPPTHTVLHHSIVWGIDIDQRLVFSDEFSNTLVSDMFFTDAWGCVVVRRRSAFIRCQNSEQPSATCSMNRRSLVVQVDGMSLFHDHVSVLKAIHLS